MPNSIRRLLVTALLFATLAATGAHAVDLTVSSSATYFHPDPVDNPPSTTAVALAPLGITPGMVLDVRTIGDWHNGPNGDLFAEMMVVFSSSNTLLAPANRHRVPGALGVGRNNRSGLSCPSGDSLDVPEDFYIDADTTIVVVPPGAQYLFVATADCYWMDNSDPDGDLRLRLTPLGVAGVTPSLAAAPPAAYPNPFARTATIRFALAREGHARLAVYDVTGRQRCVLADGAYAAGAHEVAWDGLDDARRPLPRGSYFVRITDADGSRTLKVTRLP